MNLPDLFPTEYDTERSDITVSVDSFNESGLYRIVQEFTKSKYDLVPIELKVWFVFLSKLKDYKNQTDIVYTLDPLEMADTIGLPKRKARAKKVIEVFESLMSKKIKIENKDIVDDNGVPTIYISHFLSTVYYNAKTKKLHVRMVPELHRLLFNFAKSIESVGVDLKNILSLKRTASIRLFIAIKDMDERNVRSISIEDFKEIIDCDSYPEFKELKRRVIKPVESDIRENTDYKEFSISDNGSKGRKATTLFFDMKDSDKERIETKARRNAMLDTFKTAAPSVRMKLSMASDKLLSVLEQAVFVGFDINYLSKIPLEKEGLVIENIMSALDWIYKQTSEKNKTFSADERGRLIHSAIMTNKANVVDVQEDNREKLVLTSETDSSTIEAMYMAAARKYVKAMSNNDYMAFAVNNQRDIERIYKQKFDLNELLKRDGRKSAYKLLVKYIVLLATKNQIDLGIKIK